MTAIGPRCQAMLLDHHFSAECWFQRVGAHFHAISTQQQPSFSRIARRPTATRATFYRERPGWSVTPSVTTSRAATSGGSLAIRFTAIRKARPMPGTNTSRSGGSPSTSFRQSDEAHPVALLLQARQNLWPAGIGLPNIFARVPFPFCQRFLGIDEVELAIHDQPSLGIGDVG